VTDIALRIVCKQVENFEACLFDYHVCNYRSVATPGVSLKAEQAGWGGLTKMHQFTKGFLRCRGFNVRAINCAEAMELSCARRLSARFRVAKSDKVGVLYTFRTKSMRELRLGKTSLARDGNCPYVGKPLDSDSFQSSNEPIDIGSFVANREYDAHSSPQGLLTRTDRLGNPVPYSQTARATLHLD
jgi:hypothetical protein